MWEYRYFTRNPASPRTADEWVDALLDQGWELWAAGRGAWTQRNGVEVFGVSLRRFRQRPGGPSREDVRQDMLQHYGQDIGEGPAGEAGNANAPQPERPGGGSGTP